MPPEEMIAPMAAEHEATGAPEGPGPDESKIDEAQIEDVDEEVEPLRKPRSPVTPSPAEIEDHRRSHLPYRDWCIECLMGRGLGEQRGAHAGRAHTIPRVGVDFWYITTGGIKRRDELEYPVSDDGDARLLEDRKKGKIIKCLIIRCHDTKCVFAHVIPHKGTDEDSYIVDLVCTDVAWLGHAKLIIKGDNEKALVSLINKALKVLKCQVEGLESAMPEHSQEYDSQANGGTEVGIRAVRGLFRTLKLCLEKRIGRSIPPQHPITAWLIEHTAMLITVQVRGADGLTAWARARGRAFGQKLYGFAECVLWKPPVKGPQHDTEGNMGPRLFPGVFIGYHKTSNSYRVITDDGNLVKTRAMQRLPMENRWDAEKLKNIVVTPWSLRAANAPEKVDMGPEVEKHPTPIKDIIANPRRLKITMKTLTDHGYTKDCPQCDHIRAFNEAKPGLPHTEACRQRIIESMTATPEGQARLDQYEARLHRSATAPLVEPKDVSEAAAQAPSTPKTRPDPSDAPASSASRRGGSSKDEPTDPATEPDPHATPVADANDEKMSDDDESRCPRDSDDEMMHVDPLKPKPPRKEEPDDDCLTLIAHLGVDTRSYRREHKRAMRRTVSEVYSPPRVTKVLSKAGRHPLAPGFALDITCIDPDDGEPWDFDRPEKRQKALHRIRTEKPLFLIGSPMCTAWCAWQKLNAQRRDPEVVRRELTRARLHLGFVISLYHEQLEGGRFFLHEHPWTAASWQEAMIQDLLSVDGVDLIHADQCQFGAEARTGDHRGDPLRKATGFMSNAEELLKHLSRRCHGAGGRCTRRKGGRHATVQGRITRESAKYSDKLCKAILRGMVAQMRKVGMVKNGECGVYAMDDDGKLEEALKNPEHGYSGQYRDDTSGQLLKDDLVKEARRKELQYFCSKGVWLKRPKDEARRKTGRPAITVRWVDVNKGDDLHPRYRSRLVARQLKARDRSGASFFAPTPPLEALRTVLSMAVSRIGDWQPVWDPEAADRMQISFVDIARAYFNAKLDEGEQTYVCLPNEDDDSETHCAKLLRHMYGTRAAADGWQEEYSSFLVERLGFNQGQSSPCVFRHPERQLVASVHGDDFTTAGAKHDLDWYEHELEAHYECTIQPRIGPGAEDAKEATALNRVIRWTAEGVEYEADPRQAEKLLAECGLTGARTVATPGVRVSFKEVENDTPLDPKAHTAFRGAAARANYLAADRVDCQFPAKEVCRWMASPTEGSWAALKRLCRYLVGLPRMVYLYRFQDAESVEVYTDTDWAGCPRTRKSTSGGCVMLGRHTIKSWSSTQSSIALSSGEAELNGVVRGSGVGLGYQSLLRDLGIEAPVRVWTDSSAAIGICSRQGLGKLRHLDTHTLWVQQAVRCKRIDLRKIDGDTNPADIFTKHSISRDRLIKLTDLFDCQFRGGRAESAPQMRTTPSSKTTMAEANAVEDEQTVSAEGEHPDPLMPHRKFERDVLRKLYPPLEVPEGLYDDGDDQENDLDQDDALLQEGLKIRNQIVEHAESHGRRRRVPSP
ncbi:MAG: hypothetical protein CL799_06265 [Chromatiales bacterium]|jgi:hypothetical protein|nr:hypothetical protein [Chromatiales bacterium]